MSQPTPGSSYIIQQGDTLSSIAQQAYGNANLWQEIYTTNTQVIGNNPNLISAGTKLYIPANPQSALIYLTTQTCTVTVASLHTRVRPSTESSITNSYSQGTVLNFIEVIQGETVNSDAYWGHSTQGDYFWMGGTNWQQG